MGYRDLATLEPERYSRYSENLPCCRWGMFGFAVGFLNPRPTTTSPKWICSRVRARVTALVHCYAVAPLPAPLQSQRLSLSHSRFATAAIRVEAAVREIGANGAEVQEAVDSLREPLNLPVCLNEAKLIGSGNHR